MTYRSLCPSCGNLEPIVDGECLGCGYQYVDPNDLEED